MTITLYANIRESVYETKRRRKIIKNTILPHHLVKQNNEKCIENRADGGLGLQLSVEPNETRAAMLKHIEIIVHSVDK